MDKILNIPNFRVFNYDWELLLKFVENEGNPPFHIEGDVDLSYSKINSLGTLVSVGRDLELNDAENLVSLGSLKSVGGHLFLTDSMVESLGELEFVGETLYLCRTPIKSLGRLKFVGGVLDIRRTDNLDITLDDIINQVDVDRSRIRVI